jgi:CRP-like cAMP-binding protein
MSEYVLRKLELYLQLSAPERRALAEALGHQVIIPAREDIVSEGDRPTHSAVILEGLACRYKTLADGRRQITSFGISGDWMDLHSYFLGDMDHSLAAICISRVALVHHTVLRKLIDDNPRLGQLLWRETMVDGAIGREWVVSLGARDAHSRLAYLLCELHARMKVLGIGDGSGLQLPLNQTDFADAIGVSTVHINRMFQQLRSEGLAEYGRGQIVVHDWEALARAARFDPTYLHLPEQIRALPPGDGQPPAGAQLCSSPQSTSIRIRPSRTGVESVAKEGAR